MFSSLSFIDVLRSAQASLLRTIALRSLVIKAWQKNFANINNKLRLVICIVHDVEYRFTFYSTSLIYSTISSIALLRSLCWGLANDADKLDRSLSNSSSSSSLKQFISGKFFVLF